MLPRGQNATHVEIGRRGSAFSTITVRDATKRILFRTASRQPGLQGTCHRAVLAVASAKKRTEKLKSEDVCGAMDCRKRETFLFFGNSLYISGDAPPRRRSKEEVT